MEKSRRSLRGSNNCQSRSNIFNHKTGDINLIQKIPRQITRTLGSYVNISCVNIQQLPEMYTTSSINQEIKFCQSAIQYQQEWISKLSSQKREKDVERPTGTYDEHNSNRDQQQVDRECYMQEFRTPIANQLLHDGIFLDQLNSFLLLDHNGVRNIGIHTRDQYI